MSESKRGGAQLARAVEKAYQAGLDDYHLEPMVLVENGRPVGKISDGDSAVFCCRRGEREIELTELFTDPNFDRVERNLLKDLDFVIMTMYHDKFKDLPIAFAPSHVVKPLAQVLSEAGKPVPLRRKRKICPCDLFLQRRRKRRVPRRGRRVHPVSQGH